MTLLTELDKAARDICAPTIRPSWFDRLPDDAKAELLDARRKFAAGGYPNLSKTAFARLIISAATDRGWSVCRLSGLKEWLAKKD